MKEGTTNAGAGVHPPTRTSRDSKKERGPQVALNGQMGLLVPKVTDGSCLLTLVLTVVVVVVVVLLVQPGLIVVLWYNGSRLATLLNGTEVSEAQVMTK